jgi:hypothetical protein
MMIKRNATTHARSAVIPSKGGSEPCQGENWRGVVAIAVPENAAPKETPQYIEKTGLVPPIHPFCLGRHC